MSEAQIRGKQIVDGSIVEGKLATAFTQELIRRDGSVAFTGNQSMGGQRLTNLGAPTGSADAARLQDVYNLNRKEKVVTVSQTNLTLSGEQTVNGIGLVTGDRVLVGNAQTTAADRGIYIVDTGAWSRAADADSTEELTGAVVFVDTGTTGANTNYQQIDTITTPGTTAQDWVDIGGAAAGSDPVTSNKDMTGSVTTSDGDQATATALASTPSNGSFIEVLVNGIQVNLGNGVKTESCYFSGDSGTTARSFANIVSGDTLHWNGTIAGYQLDATDRLDFNYNV